MPASMGPRSDERGNFIGAAILVVFLMVLQWGRAPMSAEILEVGARRRVIFSGFNGAALR